MLKNQTPGRPSGPRTYVRTFSCRKDEMPGTGSAPRARSARTRKNWIPSQALPSYSSISSSSGTRCRSSAFATGQCAQNVCSHVWPSVQRLVGQRERTVPDAAQRARLPARSPRIVEEIRARS